MSLHMEYPVSKNIIICSVPRSGTSLFCSYLNQTGLAGQPGEWLGRQNELRYKRRENLPEDLPLKEYIRHLQSNTAAPNGVFSIKVMGFHLNSFLQRVRSELSLPKSLNDSEVFEQIFGPCHFIHIYREELISFAISLYLAQYSHQWRSFNDLAPYIQHQVPYRYSAIKRIVESHQNPVWNAFFENSPRSPIKLSFEEITQSSPRELMANILNTLEIPYKDTDLQFDHQRTTKKQSGSRNRAWKERFLTDAKLTNDVAQNPDLLAPLPDEAFQVEIQPDSSWLAFSNQHPAVIGIKTINHSQYEWVHRGEPNGRHQPCFEFSWKDTTGKLQHQEIVELESTLPPGKITEHEPMVSLPESDGLYILEIDLLRGQDRRCSEFTGTKLTIPVFIHNPLKQAAFYFGNRYEEYKDCSLHVSWFGTLECHYFPWIRHPQLEWIYCAGNGAGFDDFWFFLPDFGLLWTRPALYPEMYSPAHDTWVKFDRIEYNHKVFEFCDSGKGFSQPILGLDIPCKLQPIL